MPLSLDAMLVQPSNSGSFTGASGSATLPTGTTAGSTLLLAIATTGTSMAATGFTDDSPVNIGTARAYLFHKSNVVAGETSWAITSAAGTINRWTIYEIDGLDLSAGLVDAKQTGTAPNITSGTTVSTGNVGPSTTYDGLVLALHVARNTASTTAPTFSGHTNGMTEMDEGGATDGTGSIGLSVSMKTVQALGTFESTATASITMTTSNTGSALIIVYSAAGAKKEARIEHFWGFKVGAGAAGLATGAAGSRYWESQVGSPAITADGLLLASSAAAENIVGSQVNFLAGQTLLAVVQRVKFRFEGSLPSVDVELLADNLAGSFLVLRYVAASQKLGLKIATGSEVLSDATVTADTWIGVDLRAISSPTLWTGDWQVDYDVADATAPVAQGQGSFAAAGNFAAPIPRLGWTNAITVPGVTFAYLLTSVIAGHYPLGEHTIVLLTPLGTPTVSGTAANFQTFTANGTMAAWNATTARDAVDEWPPTVGASADGFAAVTASATDYVEVPLATYNASGIGSIRAARVLLPMWAAATTVATCRVLGYDGTTATTLFAEADPNADNTATPAWICAMWQPSGGWTQAKLDAAAIRFGSNDATPDIGPHAIGMEVAIQTGGTIPVFGGSDPLRVEQLTDPVTGGILALHAYTPAGQGATLDYNVNGVAQGPINVPASSNPLVEVIDAPDLPTVDRIELTPDG